MARLFDDAASEYLLLSSASPVSAAPFTWACWFYHDDTAINSSLISIASGNTNYWDLWTWGTSDDSLNFTSRSGSTGTATTTNTITYSSWQHAVGIESATDDRRVVLNGNWASSGTSGTAVSPTAGDFGIGANVRPATTQYMSGRICEVAVWNVALTQIDVETLYNGGVALPAYVVRPDKLVFYAPLFNADGDIDWFGDGTYDMSPQFTPSYAEHVPLILPLPIIKPAAATGAGPISLGLATETDTAQVLTPLEVHDLGLSTETDTAQSLTPVRAIDLGLATETDTALSLTPSQSGAVIIGLATETDTAQSLTPLEVHDLGLSTETDTAQSLTPNLSRIVALGLATETDTAPALTVNRARTIVLGNASETNTALSVSPDVPTVIMLGLATETDTARSISGASQAVDIEEFNPYRVREFSPSRGQ